MGHDPPPPPPPRGRHLIFLRSDQAAGDLPEELREAALQVGRALAPTVNQAAEAFRELGRAGVSASSAARAFGDLARPAADAKSLEVPGPLADELRAPARESSSPAPPPSRCTGSDTPPRVARRYARRADGTNPADLCPPCWNCETRYAIRLRNRCPICGERPKPVAPPAGPAPSGNPGAR